jgi:hypothetical protein
VGISVILVFMEKKIKVVALGGLNDKLRTINKKLAKRGEQPITYTASPIQYERIMVGENAFLEPVVVSLPFYDVTLHLPFENLGFADTIPLGYVEITTAGDLILHPMSKDAAPRLEAFRKDDIHCDHCNKVRNRKSTFIFDKAGETLMVGNACSQEFFGRDIAGLLNEYIGIKEGFGGNDPEDYITRGRRAFNRQLFMALTLFVIRRIGFKPASAEFGSTASVVSDLKYCIGNKDSKSDDRETRELLEEFREKGKELVEQIGDIYAWYESLETTDSFLLNCRAAIRDEFYSRGPLLVAAVNAYFKAVFSEYEAARRAKWAQERLDREAQKALSQHVGTKEGDRVEVVVTIKDKVALESDWGSLTLVKMVTENFGEVAWFTGSNTYDIEIGKQYVCKGTVKAHGDYKGTKQTKMNRCKLTPVPCISMVA